MAFTSPYAEKRPANTYLSGDEAFRNRAEIGTGRGAEDRPRQGSALRT